MARAVKKPDAKLAHDQLQALQALKAAWGVELFMQTMVWILTKKVEVLGKLVSPSRLIPFRFNRIQRYLEIHMALWNAVLKARQQGLTTYFLLRQLYLPAVLEPGVGCLLISQSTEYAQEHFAMVRRAHKNFGAVDPFDQTKNELNISLRDNLLHTAYSNRRELVLDMIDSRIRIASAEVEEAGQGITLQHIVASEYARWPGKPEDTLSNVMGSLAPGGTLDKESTANMAVGPFYEEMVRAMENPKDSAAKGFFFPWWWSDEYADPLNNAQAAELEADLSYEELLIIQSMQKDLAPVAWNQPHYVQGVAA